MIEKVTLTNFSTGKTSTQCIRLVKTDVEDSLEVGGETGPAQAGPSVQPDPIQGMTYRSNEQNVLHNLTGTR